MSADALLREAFEAIESLRAKLARYSEPIAVIGFGERLPGGPLWTTVESKIDASSEIPKSRWNADEDYDPERSTPGKSITKRGSFIGNIEDFDNEFFEIGPVEARTMDPQQRIALECSYEAIQNAAIPIKRLYGEKVGVFFGVWINDYAETTRQTGDSTNAPYLVSGAALSILAGRIAYTFGFMGPTLVVDTACSSSLVGLHLACESLHHGTSNVALAGGVNLLGSRRTYREVSQLGVLSPDGRCKAFDAKADGFGRAEGCAVVVLKRLSDAVRDGDRVLAVIRGTAVNHDGHSDGLTAPNGVAQAELLRQALEVAKCEPQDVQYVEAHGTGTVLGDPIEVQALTEVFGPSHTKTSPLVIGTVKSNIGHLEGAAGVAGLLKAILSIQHRLIPASIHFKTPNPHIPWDRIPLRVQTELGEWPEPDKPLIAGVSSFGISGTNSHAIIAEPSEAELSWSDADRLSSEAKLLPLCISAKTEAALTAYAMRFADYLSGPLDSAVTWRDIAFTANLRGSHHSHRLVVVGADIREWADRLRAFASEERPPDVATGVCTDDPGRPVFVFSGQGTPWWGMGRELIEREPVFRAAVESCAKHIGRHTDWSLLEELARSEEASRLHQTDIAQPALVAIQLAMVELLASWGVTPAAVVGHSVGEISAACAAGVLTLEDACFLAAVRGKAMHKARGAGKMAAVRLSADRAEALARDYRGRLVVGAYNGPRATVLSGDADAIEQALRQLKEQGVETKELGVDYAFHCHQMVGAGEELADALRSLRRGAPRIPIVSTLSGSTEGASFDGTYWVRQMREPVRFAQAIQQLLDRGNVLFVEVGPQPALLAPIDEIAADRGKRVALVATLRRNHDQARCALRALGAIHCGGIVDWNKFFTVRGRVAALPTYPWQRKRNWIEASPAQSSAGEATDHPLLGTRLSTAAAAAVYEVVISRSTHPWAYDHLIGGKPVLAGAALAELLRAAGEHGLDGAPAEVTSLVFESPLVLPEDGAQRIQIVLSQSDRMEASIFSQPADAKAGAIWTVHATAEVRAATSSTPPKIDPTEFGARSSSRAVDVERMHARFAAKGLVYGAAFRGLKDVRVSPTGDVVAEVFMTESPDEAERYGIHPTLLDAALRAAVGASEMDQLALPFAIDRLTVHAPGATSAFVHVRAGDPTASDVTLADSDGRVLVEVIGFRRRVVDGSAAEPVEARRAALPLYRFEWPVVAPASASPPMFAGRWVVVGAEGDARVVAIAKGLAAGGASSATPTTAARLREMLPSDNVVCVWSNETKEVASEALQLATEALSIVQTMLAEAKAPRLWWVTSGAVAVDRGDRVEVAQGALWGLGRTVMQEHPELECTLADVDPASNIVDQVLRHLGVRDDESQVAWRGGDRHVQRLVRAPLGRGPEGENYALRTAKKGTLDQLELVPVERRSPGVGEVEISVCAAGLNFRDTLNALGMYPGAAPPLGGECAGVVVAVGPGVTRVAVGDEVMALAAGSFQRFVTIDARCVVRIPAGLTFEQAATIPAVFLTAWYGLHDLANMKAGERLLVHAAAGGVGLAAVQLARWHGVEVLGTASPSKWDVVRASGVETLASSRDLSFVEAFRKATNGAGVDVVLNALAGEFIDASLSLLGKGGRFIEMGKADLRDSKTIEAKYAGTTYRAFDLAEVPHDRVASMLDAIAQGIADGHLRPLPVRTYEMTEAEAAFRFLAQGRNVGKLALVPPRAPRTNGTVLVTGGLGALGLLFARYFARHGVEHIVLTGRRGLETPGAMEAVAEIEALGARVTVAAVDVVDRDAVAKVLADIPNELPLRGVVHAAGVLDDGLIREQNAKRFARVVLPKVAGAAHLDALTRGMRLDFFVLFSSIAGALGSAGQAPYAAANAALDALAAHRRADGLPGQSLGWGLWSDAEKGTGMASQLDEAQLTRLEREGFGAITTEDGLAFFESALARQDAHLVPVRMNLNQLRTSFGDSVPSLWRSLVKAGATRHAQAKDASLVAEMTVLPPARRLEALSDLVRGQVARVMGLSGLAPVSAERPVKELGLDSLMAVELRNALGKRIGKTLPATLAFDHPTPAAMAKFILEKVLGLDAAAAAAPAVTAAHGPHPTANEPIAIVGVGCRFPGGVTDLGSFWRLVDEGVDAVQEVPRDRWDVDAWYDPRPGAVGKISSRFGGFLDLRQLSEFDAPFFGISPVEAPSIDPQARLLLETSWEALEHAGIDPTRLMGSDTGVYVGICGMEYFVRAMKQPDRIDAYSAVGGVHSTTVGRISYWLGLKGPNVPVDTACSSSLVAVHLACQALRNGECRMALAGGVNITLDPEFSVSFSRLGALSPTGRCHTFSADADGYVRAEGVGVIILERLSDAIRNGRKILGLIRGSAVNQDGRSNGLTAPNGPSQEAVIREALEQAGVAAGSVGYLECHGTGTPLGDPIEVQAAASVLGRDRRGDQPLVLGSVKTNIGHTEGAAGIAGLIKALTAIQHRRIPKNRHFTSPNPHIPWSELPVKVAAEPIDWPRSGEPRRAGVSSFGFSGTNVHVVLEEAPESSAATAPSADSVDDAHILVLSAKRDGALREQAKRYEEHLASRNDQSLRDVFYSAAISRAHFERRAAIVARGREGVREALGGIL